MSNNESAARGSLSSLGSAGEVAAATVADLEIPPDLIEDHILPKLDPEFLRYFVSVVAKQPPAHLIPLEDIRADPAKYRSPIALDSSRYERVADYIVSSQDGASIPVRVYHPDPQKFGPGPYPLHMNHHGTSCRMASEAHIR